MQQYLEIKEQHKDAILFYRMGDFYEMFFDDAELAAKELEITLTSRNKNDKRPIPMCGVPFRAAQNYIGRLSGRGHKVAICDQEEESAADKGLVRREVVRIVTPGMVLENDFLDEKENNFVLSVAEFQDKYGLACLDISTGTFRVTQSDDLPAVTDEAIRIAPREIILAESIKNSALHNRLTRVFQQTATSFLEDRFFSHTQARSRVLEQFNTANLEGFGCEHLKAAVSAAGGLIYYVQETQLQKVSHLSGIETYLLGSYLWVDDTSCRNLELLKNTRTGSNQGTLLSVLDRTITAMGGRLLRHWIRYPLLDPVEMETRFDALEETLAHTDVQTGIRTHLKSVSDLERLGSKIALGQCNARDLLALKRSLQELPAVRSLLSNLNSPLFIWPESPSALSELADRIDKAIREDAPLTIREGGMMKVGFNEALDTLIELSRDGKGWLVKLEAQEKAATGISTLKVRYNKVFGYYIEIPRSQSENVPGNYVRKQTLVNAERYITDELKTFENQVLGAEEKRAAMEYKLFSRLREEIAECNELIQIVGKFVAQVDCLMSLTQVAQENGYCRPGINTQGELLITDGRHPVVEKMITGERFVPNTIAMDNVSSQVLIITGPNMAGKSTVLRQVALLVIMAQTGSFVPAASAELPVMDRIFTRVGALDNLSAGQSTFMVEMQETANILNNATENSLVIMDEIGRGTSTFDGLSIAWAVAESLHDLKGRGVKTL
ncbi:MAG: DNA mismatch repair protein MutS, partial [Deltaproteobacteria bacterium]|nr:DNA mismatch repair protein MutS [Deltaproteobacteria bacterium]